MYKFLSFSAGSIIAVMILSNGIMMDALGNTPAVLLNHIIGLSCIGLIFFLGKNKWHTLKGIPIFFLLAGFTGIISVAFTNIAFMGIGATLTLMIGMVSRVMSSIVIDSLGLFGMTKYPFKPVKLIGLIIMITGVVLIMIG